MKTVTASQNREKTEINVVTTKPQRATKKNNIRTTALERSVEAEYRGLVRPILEYGSCVWDPQGVVLQKDIERKFRIGLPGLLLAITLLKLGV